MPADSPQHFVRKTSYVEIGSVDIDADGNVIVAGYPHAAAIVGLGEGDVPFDPGVATVALVWSYDPRGELRWLAPIHAEQVPHLSPEDEATIQVTAMPNGESMVVVGAFEDFWIARVDAAGQVAYVRHIAGGGRPSDISATDERMYACALRTTAQDFGCDPLPTTVAEQGEPFFLELNTSDGSCVRAFPWIGPRPRCVAVEPRGSEVFFAGSFIGELTLGGRTVGPGATDNDAQEFVAAINQDGSARFITHFRSNAIGGLWLQEAGDFWLTSSYRGEAPELGVPVREPGAPDYVQYLAHFDADGVHQSLSPLPGGDQYPPPKFAGGSGPDAYVAYVATLPADASTGTAASRVLTLVRVDQEGDLHDLRRFPHSVYPGEPWVTEIATNAQGTTAFVGNFLGNLTFGELTIVGPPDSAFRPEGYIAVFPRDDRTAIVP